jgi:thioredoxin reductase (NADPH)
MTTSTDYDVIIIGGGPAGATAAIYAARANLSTLVLDAGLTLGALGMAGTISNFPGIPSATGADMVNSVRKHAEAMGATFIKTRVVGSDLKAEPKLIFTEAGDYSSRAVIIATGAMGRSQKAPGEADLVGKGVSYCATCDGAFFRGKRVAVVGTTEQAVEEALFLTRFAGQIEFLCPTPEIKVSTEQDQEVKTHARIRFHPRIRLIAIEGLDHVTGVRVSTGDTEETIPVDGVFIYLQGNNPATDFVEGQIPRTGNGCLHVNEFLETGLPGVYAAGDVLCSVVRQAVIAASQGCIAAIQAEKYLRGRERARADWKKD